MGGGGASPVLPLQIGGRGRTSFRHAERGHTKFWGSFNAGA